jgi:hypothetical protein
LRIGALQPDDDVRAIHDDDSRSTAGDNHDDHDGADFTTAVI